MRVQSTIATSFHNYVFFSVTKVSDKVIGYGLLNNVWIFNEVRSAFADKKPRKKTNTSDYGQQATDIINSINRVYATNKSDTKYKPKDVTRKPLKTFDVSKSKRMENYEKLKDLTRGNLNINKESLHSFIKTLNLPEEDKDYLLNLTPHNYIGNAKTLAKKI